MFAYRRWDVVCERVLRTPTLGYVESLSPTLYFSPIQLLELTILAHLLVLVIEIVQVHLSKVV